MSDQNGIIVGVVSGVLTSALLFIAAKLFENTIMPAIRRVIYRGVDISGSWYWENRFGSAAKMEIKQYADRLNGTYTYVNPTTSVIKTYEIKGGIQDRFVQLSLRSNDQQKLGVLSYVFEVVGDGCELRGCSSFYSTNSHEIASEQESFFRDAAIAKKLAQDNKIETQKFLSYIAGIRSDSEMNPSESRSTSNANEAQTDRPAA
jgi:hypothetical protein